MFFTVALVGLSVLQGFGFAIGLLAGIFAVNAIAKKIAI